MPCIHRIKTIIATIGLCAISAAWSGAASAQVIDCNTAGPDALQDAIDQRSLAERQLDRERARFECRDVFLRVERIR